MAELRQVDVKELRALEDERDVLAAERAALLEQVVYWRECATESNAERDALAAHVERLQDALKAYTSLGVGYVAVCDYEYSTALSVLHAAPATSLAKRKAESWAEGMHRALCILESEFDPCHPIIERLEQIEAEARQQVEGR